MDVVIIGSGNAAFVIGRKLFLAGHRIVQVVGRNTSAASSLAYELQTESVNYQSVINRSADLYLIAVSDNAIAGLVSGLRLPGKLIVHTAASVSKEVLKDVSDDFGVLYPLQSLREETGNPEIPFYVDASNDQAMTRLRALADSVSSRPVVKATDQERIKLHLAAVFVSNFPNHLYALMEQYCSDQGMDFQQFYPLIEETTRRLRGNRASQLQTGPARRADQETLDKHLALLSAYPRMDHIYQSLSSSIRAMY